jgi:hypothetical protein
MSAQNPHLWKRQTASGMHGIEICERCQSWAIYVGHNSECKVKAEPEPEPEPIDMLDRALNESWLDRIDRKFRRP